MFFYVKYKKNGIFCIFFEKNFAVSQILFTFAPVMPAHVRVGHVKNLHRWNETSGHLYGQSRRAFSNVTVCVFKSCKLESKYSGNATESVYVG